MAGRPLAFDQAICVHRNLVERCINRLKQWRGLATRYEKRAVNYRAMLVLTSLVLWLEGDSSRHSVPSKSSAVRVREGE